MRRLKRAINQVTCTIRPVGPSMRGMGTPIRKKNYTMMRLPYPIKVCSYPDETNVTLDEEEEIYNEEVANGNR